MKINKTVKMVGALVIGTTAFALELAAIVISIPANVAGWCATKLMDVATKVVDVKEEADIKTDGTKIIEEIAAL